MRVDDSAVTFIEEKVPRQLVRRWLAVEPGVPVPLIVGEKTDRHGPPFCSGEGLQNLQVLRRNSNRSFSQEFRLQKYAAKSTVNARIFARAK
jgi:hypothetical protein